MKTSLVLLTAILSFAAIDCATAADVEFVMHRIGDYRSEAIGVGDFNGDEKIDVVAGPFVYLAPDWKKVKIRELAGEVDEQGRGYMHDFANIPVDVDQDGRLDVVAAMWHEKHAVWYRNVGCDGTLWPETVIIDGDNYESAAPADMDADGKIDEVVPHTRKTYWFEPSKDAAGKPVMLAHKVSDENMNFGAGEGDITGDGRVDMLRPNAWFEAPQDIRAGEWTRHDWLPADDAPAESLHPLGPKAEHTAQILALDINGDGLKDVIASSAHRYGIFWYEQVKQDGEICWRKHKIDDSWSQIHSLRLGDIDGDGDLDMVCGKRFYAHNGGDPGADEQACVYWYELDEGKFTRHTVSAGAGIGSGMDIPLVDLDGDGDLDIVVTGKWGGPVWFENRTK